MKPIKSLRLAALGCTFALGALGGCGGVPEDAARAPLELDPAQQDTAQVHLSGRTVTNDIADASTTPGTARAVSPQTAINCASGLTVRSTLCDLPVSRGMLRPGPGR